jgi:hypothetical protein
MNSDRSTVRLLGIAFLLQAVASAVSGLVLLQPLIVSGNIVDSMTNIANNALQMRASIVVEMITAIGIVMLGSLLFVTLKVRNGKIALVALGLYLMEAALLAASRIPAFSLLRTSQESVIAGHPPICRPWETCSMNPRALDTIYICCPLPLGQRSSITYSSDQDFSHGFYLFGASLQPLWH